MDKYIVFHNPRCSKSREALKILEKQGADIEIVEYLKEPLNLKQLNSVFAKLKLRPKEVLRRKEKVFKELNLDLENDREVTEAIIENPVLLERPIIIQGQKAVVGRPPENVKKLLG